MQVYDWTGFYIGVNAGFGVGQDRTRLDIPALPSAEQSHLSPFGAIGGAQVGYNWQVNKTGWSAWRLTFRRPTSATAIPALSPAPPSSAPTQPAARLVRHGARPRRLVKGSVLSYFTGGLAYGHYSTTVTEAGGVLAPAPSPRAVRRSATPSAAASRLRSAATGPARSSICMSTSAAEPQLRAARHAAGALDPHPRQHLPRRPELSHRRRRELQSAAGQLDRVLSRR